MSDQEASQSASPSGPDLADPAGKAVDEPHLSADELKSEVGDSEAWDEASQDEGGDLLEDGTRPADRSAI